MTPEKVCGCFKSTLATPASIPLPDIEKLLRKSISIGTTNSGSKRVKINWEKLPSFNTSLQRGFYER